MKYPSLETLTERNLAQIQAALPNVEPQGKGILEVMARMHAGAMHSAYGMIDYHTQQLFPQSASGERPLRGAFLDNLLKRLQGLGFQHGPALSSKAPLPALLAVTAFGSETGGGYGDRFGHGGQHGSQGQRNCRG
ncbi:MAG: hypothetical protein AAF975_02445 [Spirochaetota bacterium]